MNAHLGESRWPAQLHDPSRQPRSVTYNVNTIIVLVVVGFLLVAAEMFLPGLVLGILGAVLLISAIVVAFTQFGMEVGTIVSAIILVVTTIGFFVWMAIFPRTAIGRKLTLSQSLQDPDCDVASLIGLEGTAITPLRPAGTALIDGKKIDVVAESSYVDKKETILVIAAKGSRVLVRKKG